MRIKNIRIVYDFEDYKKEIRINDDFSFINKDYLKNNKIIRKEEGTVDFKKYRRITRLIDDLLKDDLQYDYGDYLFELYLNEDLKDEIIISGSMDVIPYEIYEELDKIIKIDIK